MKTHEKIALVALACGYEIQDIEADGTCWIYVGDEESADGERPIRLFAPHINWEHTVEVAAVLSLDLLLSQRGRAGVARGFGLEMVMHAYNGDAASDKLAAIREGVMTQAVAIGLKKQRHDSEASR